MSRIDAEPLAAHAARPTRRLLGAFTAIGVVLTSLLVGAAIPAAADDTTTISGTVAFPDGVEPVDGGYGIFNVYTHDESGTWQYRGGLPIQATGTDDLGSFTRSLAAGDEVKLEYYSTGITGVVSEGWVGVGGVLVASESAAAVYTVPSADLQVTVPAPIALTATAKLSSGYRAASKSIWLRFDLVNASGTIAYYWYWSNDGTKHAAALTTGPMLGFPGSYALKVTSGVGSGYLTSAGGLTDAYGKAKRFSASGSVTVDLRSHYRIVYTLGGGTTAGNPTSYAKSTATFTLKGPTRTGYAFTGWTGTSHKKATKKVTVKKGSTGSRSYTAHWKAKRYKVAFKANGGKGSIAKEAFTYGKSKALTSNRFKRSGYVFQGWARSKSGEVRYRNKAEVRNLCARSGATVTLYAVWRKR